MASEIDSAEAQRQPLAVIQALHGPAADEAGHANMVGRSFMLTQDGKAHGIVLLRPREEAKNPKPYTLKYTRLCCGKVWQYWIAKSTS